MCSYYGTDLICTIQLLWHTYYVRNGWQQILHSHQCKSDPIFADLNLGSLDCETFTIIIIYQKTWSWMLLQWRLHFNFESQFQSWGAETVRLKVRYVPRLTWRWVGEADHWPGQAKIMLHNPHSGFMLHPDQAAALIFLGSMYSSGFLHDLVSDAMDTKLAEYNAAP